MKDFENTIQQLSNDFSSVIKKIIPDTVQQKGFLVASDVIQTESQLKIIADLPGLSKENVKINLFDGTLTISGERVFGYEYDSLIKSERQKGRFNKSFKVPEGVKSSDIKASFEKGVLTITVDLTSVQSMKTEIEIE